MARARQGAPLPPRSERGDTALAMTASLHHVGIVQPSEARALSMMRLMDLEEDFRGYVPQFQALCIFTRAQGRSPVEFVIPDGGALARFNPGVGGLHHIALETPDLRALMARFAAKGMPLLEPEPVKGAGDFLCNFLGPVHGRGVVIEFVELLGG